MKEKRSTMKKNEKGKVFNEEKWKRAEVHEITMKKKRCTKQNMKKKRSKKKEDEKETKNRKEKWKRQVI